MGTTRAPASSGMQSSPQWQRRSGWGLSFPVWLQSSHFHCVHLGGAPALDLTGPEHRAVIHTAAGEEPCEGEDTSARCSAGPLPLSSPPHPHSLESCPHPPHGPSKWRERTGRASGVPLWHTSPAQLFPPLLPALGQAKQGDNPPLIWSKPQPPDDTCPCPPVTAYPSLPLSLCCCCFFCLQCPF